MRRFLPTTAVVLLVAWPMHSDALDGCPVVVMPCAPTGFAPSAPRAQMPGQSRADSFEGRYATPTAAPPSAEPALTASISKPEVSESHTAVETYVWVPKPSDKLRPDRCLVRFWNLSKQPITLKTDGQTRTLARGASAQLELPREFVWQVGDREPQSAKAPATAVGLDIVIRGQQ